MTRKEGKAGLLGDWLRGLNFLLAFSVQYSSIV